MKAKLLLAIEFEAKNPITNNPVDIRYSEANIDTFIELKTIKDIGNDFKKVEDVLESVADELGDLKSRPTTKAHAEIKIFSTQLSKQQLEDALQSFLNTAQGRSVANKLHKLTLRFKIGDVWEIIERSIM